MIHLFLKYIISAPFECRFFENFLKLRAGNNFGFVHVTINVANQCKRVTWFLLYSDSPCPKG